MGSLGSVSTEAGPWSPLMHGTRSMKTRGTVGLDFWFLAWTNWMQVELSLPEMRGSRLGGSLGSLLASVLSESDYTAAIQVVMLMPMDIGG